MKIYDEITGAELTAPDENKGYTYPGRRQTGTRREILPGTAALYPPDGLQREVPIYEDCLIYHAYSEEELAAQQEPPSGLDTRVAALETGQADLQEALDLLLSGATE